MLEKEHRFERYSVRQNQNVGRFKIELDFVRNKPNPRNNVFFYSTISDGFLDFIPVMLIPLRFASND